MTITTSRGLIRTPGLDGPLSRFSGLALVVAVVAVETLAVVLLQQRGYGHAVEALYLIGVLVVSVVCELGWRSPPRWGAPSHSYMRMPGSIS